MKTQLTQALAQYLHNVEHKTFAEIGRQFDMTRQAVHALYNYKYISQADKKKPGPKRRGTR